ncbi:hypothetical protein LR013_04065 [candidate division NPL-UPA2 bacterium]|nr:hypothetical protein [candidate division NPL-UPA2 bacterium]
MTSREIVIRAVKFQRPERVPRDLPEPFGTDFFSVAIEPDPNWKPNVEGEDEWGCIWQKLPGDKTMGQVKVHPLDDYARLDNYTFPDYDLPVRYEKIGERIKENSEQKFVLATIPLSLIHRLEYLRGHTAAWTDPYEHPQELSHLLDIMADIAIKAIQHLAERGVDGIFSCDDWGLQDRPMISLEVFCQFFKPRYKRVYQAAHQLGMLTFLHSCGHIMELLDDFIEAELDVIQMDQQENMGVENLANSFGGRMCFWCPVDIQQTMVKGTLEDIRSYAKHLIDSFGRFNGGFIAKWYPSPAAIGHSQERIDAMAEAFVKYGNY